MHPCIVNCTRKTYSKNSMGLSFVTFKIPIIFKAERLQSKRGNPIIVKGCCSKTYV